MASVRRTLSPVPRPGARSNGEVCSVASPLSKSSSSFQSSLHPSGLSYSSFDSLEYALYRVHSFIMGMFSQRSSRPLDRPKPKGHVWKRAILHFLVCFFVGVFIGLTPFGSINLLGRLMPKHQRLFFDMIPSAVKYESSLYMLRNDLSMVGSQLDNSTTTVERQDGEKITLQEAHQGLKEQTGRISSEALVSNTIDEDSALEIRKLLIIVTPTHNWPFQAYYLNRLAQTLKLVPPPLLWIVVDMTSQSAETADILRKTGVMYRHLVCNENITDVRDRNTHQRNVALAHIEKHHLDGVVYFADDSNVYSLELFAELRQIRRFGTWKVAKLSVTGGGNFLDGPVCNGSEVIGWKTTELTRRFHADISGFAFNSTILWDPKRWHRPTLDPIRQLGTVKDNFLVSAFIEQIVEDESRMEGVLGNCLSIMVWSLPLESCSSVYPQQWVISRSMEKHLAIEDA